ncbi:MAG: hypothetical protein BGP06_05540 [Rhizobiales bacterium 65-9]|nr:hypothetical protein [Hyphomicrobiales bacterium]OJY35337.1 MAG: hypothetical protein BGP06_05540 [Rhizobiales bacterium 65-9]
MAETDLYAPVKRFLEAQGYCVKAEIRDCDLVAIRGEEPPVVVELKRAFSLKLVLQGVDRQSLTDAVYLAIGLPRRHDPDIHKLCRRLGLGLLTVSGDHVEAALDPAPYQPRKNGKRQGMLLKEFAHRVGDPNLGGSARRRPLMTAYRQDALRCIRFLDRTGPSRPALIRTEAGVARAGAMLRDDVYGWFIRVERGVYDLSPKGRAALADFAQALAAL